MRFVLALEAKGHRVHRRKRRWRRGWAAEAEQEILAHQARHLTQPVVKSVAMEASCSHVDLSGCAQGEPIFAPSILNRETIRAFVWLRLTAADALKGALLSS